MNLRNFAMAAALLAGCALTGANEMVVKVDRPGATVQPTMYGLFFEDINYAADGGLYAELVKNRSFEFPQNLMGWMTAGKVEVRDDGPFERNPHYVRLSPSGHNDKHTALVNEGFFGIGVKKGEPYTFSVWARVPDGGQSKLRIELADRASAGETQVIAKADFTVDSREWKKYDLTLTPSATQAKAELRIFLVHPDVTVDLEHVSLFPATFNNDPNGLRADLAQALADIKPGVLRFPGGCIVEGTDIDTRYNWKNSVGPVENRPLNENRWRDTFTKRFYPDYYQSYGLGFYEFFRLAEEIGAAPLPIVNVGLACQYQNRSMDAHIPVDSLQPYIQDALDLIEFANGDTTTTWGALRASMGHPAPFNLRHIGIGNEQWGPEYVERLEPFMAAVRKAHPEILIVGSSGPDSEGGKFDFLWPEMTRLKADLVDEHFYRPESWFLSQGARYDNYDRKGPKVFAGEYACHGKGKKWNHFNAALLEAAFMTGLERNADIVHMATYAPLFAHTEGWQWRPDMIWFDNLDMARTSSYYVQQLFSLNKGTRTVPLTMNGAPVTGAEGQNGLFASAVTDDPTGDLIVKVANTSAQTQPLTLDLERRKKKSEGPVSATVTTLASADPDADNTPGQPEKVTPQVTTLALDGSTTFSTTLAPNTFTVIRFNFNQPNK